MAGKEIVICPINRTLHIIYFVLVNNTREVYIMENFIFEKGNGIITKKDILYSGLYAVLIAVIVVFGFMLVFSVDVAHCNLVRLVVSFFIVMITTMIILLIRKC